MILVNTPGSWSHVYPPLRHAEWHGSTPTDLVFPFFIFILGVSLCYSQRTASLSHVLRRGLILIGIGLFINAFYEFDLGILRIPGVLQRIGLVYICAATLVLTLRSARVQAWICVGLLLGYWALIAGDLTPEGNLGARIDRALFGTHLWKETWDPEALLGTIPATATALLGALTGRWLRGRSEPREAAGWMFVVGWAAILAGLVWDAFLPINKNLWTSSYVVFTAGAALHLFAICHWLIDVTGYRRWARPFIAFGVNPLLLYAGSMLFTKLLATANPWIYEHGFASWAGPWFGSLAFAIANVLLWYAVAEVLYRRRIFVKV